MKERQVVGITFRLDFSLSLSAFFSKLFFSILSFHFHFSDPNESSAPLLAKELEKARNQRLYYRQQQSPLFVCLSVRLLVWCLANVLLKHFTVALYSAEEVSMSSLLLPSSQRMLPFLRSFSIKLPVSTHEAFLACRSVVFVFVFVFVFVVVAVVRCLSI